MKSIVELRSLFVETKLLRKNLIPLFKIEIDMRNILYSKMVGNLYRGILFDEVNKIRDLIICLEAEQANRRHRAGPLK